MNGGIRGETDLPPHWLPWFGVASTEAAAEQAIAAGGQVLVAAHDLPPGGRLGVILDPQGAPFAVYEGDGRRLNQLLKQSNFGIG